MSPTVVNQNNNTSDSKEIDTKIILFNHISEHENVLCFTCNSTAVGKDIPNHLFLGRLDCRYCTIKIANCSRFKEIFFSNTSICKQSKSGKHEFSKWHTSCSEYLSYFLRREVVIERFCQNRKGPPTTEEILKAIRDYLIKLSVIENYDPWNTELKNIWNYLESKNLGKLSCNNDSDSEEPFPELVELFDEAKTPSKNIISTEDSSLVNKQKQPEVSSLDFENSGKNNENKEDNIECKDEATIISQQETMKMQELNEEKMIQSNTNAKGEGEALLPKDMNIQEQDVPDHELLSAFSIGGIDQTIEYVSVQDGGRKKENVEVREEGKNVHDSKTSCKKRKFIDESYCKSKKRVCHKHQDGSPNFQPPEEIKNDSYLILHFPTDSCPEECPNCYCEFAPSMLTVNCNTFVSTIICEDCKLTIYVLPE